jgi:hypothetical protein
MGRVAAQPVNKPATEASKRKFDELLMNWCFITALMVWIRLFVGDWRDG